METHILNLALLCNVKIRSISAILKNNSKLWAYVILIILPQASFAAEFDVDAAGRAMFNPIITFIDAWYGTGIFAAGIGGAVVSSGDLRTRALGFGIGSVIAGLTLLGVKAGYDIKPVAQNIMNII